MLNWLSNHSRQSFPIPHTNTQWVSRVKWWHLPHVRWFVSPGWHCNPAGCDAAAPACTSGPWGVPHWSPSAFPTGRSPVGGSHCVGAVKEEKTQKVRKRSSITALLVAIIAPIWGGVRRRRQWQNRWEWLECYKWKVQSWCIMLCRSKDTQLSDYENVNERCIAGNGWEGNWSSIG